MTSFRRQLEVPVSRRALHDWHLREGAFERLGPPWETMRHIHAEALANGSKRVFALRKGGLWVRWVARHQDVVDGERFTDIQEKGPFKRWEHTHRFEEAGPETSHLVDQIEYALPAGALGRALGGGSVARELERMFTYRHRVTLQDCSFHDQLPGSAPMRVAVTGASGLIGQQLVAFLRTGGHTVFRLVRSTNEPASDEIRWSIGGGVRDLVHQ